jgi:hypothetical protein
MRMRNACILILIFVGNISFAQSFFQMSKVVASDRNAFDKYAESLSISGDYAAVGAPFEDEDENGQNSLTDAGAVYILKRNATTGMWLEHQKLVASDRAVNDLFGTSVSLDDDILVIGAPLHDKDVNGLNSKSNAGIAYIFKKSSSGQFSQLQKIQASDRETADEFASSVSVSANNILIGAPNQDYDHQGQNSMQDAGAVYFFEENPSSGVWQFVAKQTASDRGNLDNFGYSVAISGQKAIVGAPGEDEDASGLNTATDAGSVYLFTFSSQWTQTQKLCATDRDEFDYFGASVSIYGDVALVGAYAEDEDVSGNNFKNSAGSAYILQDLTPWTQTKKLVANDREATDYFGYSVHISEDFAIVGACLEDENASGGQTENNAGSAYVFKASSNWGFFKKIVASDRFADDRLGCAVASDKAYVIVGAPLEDHDASGQNTLSASGSAYVFPYGYQIHLYDTICQGDVYPYGSENLTKAGTYRKIFTSWEGYDSLMYLHLHVNPVFQKTISKHICQGETYTFGGKQLNATGQYSHTYQSIKGCDSGVVLNLEVHPIHNVSVTKNLCNGKSLKFGKQIISSGGNYTEVFTSYFGCDSTVHLTVNMKAIYDIHINETICRGESFSLGSTKYWESGNYTKTFKTTFACDSVVHLSLTVSKQIDTSVSRSGSQLSANATSATYQWIDCDMGYATINGATNKTFHPVKNGSYAVIVEQFNCSDTSACYPIHSIGLDEYHENGLLLYPNPTKDKVHIECVNAFDIQSIRIMNSQGKQLHHLSPSGKSIDIDLSGWSKGIYLLQIQYAEGVYSYRLIKE